MSNATDSTPDPFQNTLNGSPVIWQSAFINLILLAALPVLTQDTVDTFGLSSAISPRLFRCFPILCIVESVTTFARFLLLLIILRSTCAAAKATREYRADYTLEWAKPEDLIGRLSVTYYHYHEDDSCEENHVYPRRILGNGNEPGNAEANIPNQGALSSSRSPPKADMTWWFHFILWAFLALQASRLFAFQGLPVTTTFGLAYFIAFTMQSIVFVLSVLSRDYPQRIAILRSHGLVRPVFDICIFCIFMLAICLQVYHLLFLVSCSIEFNPFGDEPNVLITMLPVLVMAIIIFVALGLVFVPVMETIAQSVRHEGMISRHADQLKQTTAWLFGIPEKVVVRCAKCIMFIVVWVVAVFLMFYLMDGLAVREQQAQNMKAERLNKQYLAFVFAMLGGLVWYLLGRVLIQGGLSATIERVFPYTSMSSWMMLYIVGIYTVSGFLYYSLHYDPSQTYKPPWMDMLG